MKHWKTIEISLEISDMIIIVDIEFDISEYRAATGESGYSLGSPTEPAIIEFVTCEVTEIRGNNYRVTRAQRSDWLAMADAIVTERLNNYDELCEAVGSFDLEP